MQANLKNSTSDLGVEKARESVENRMTDNADKMRKGGTRGGMKTMAPEYENVGKSLVLLHVNCRNIYNKTLEFWNSVDTYNPDIIIGMEPWLREEIGNLKIFRQTS
jgi:hypothetical protein